LALARGPCVEPHSAGTRPQRFPIEDWGRSPNPARLRDRRAAVDFPAPLRRAVYPVMPGISA
jgi:hypothetical protein